MEKDTVKRNPQTIIVPESIEYPDIRIHLDDLAKNDKIIVQILVKDKHGIEKVNQTEKINLIEYPTDNKVIGRLSFNLVESN